MEFDSGKLTKDGMHYHFVDAQRIGIYRELMDFIGSAWEHTGQTPIIALCKETKGIRAALGVTHSHCNCE
jgi:hypothetical protein